MFDKSGIGMNLAENLARDYPHVVPESFTNDSQERWATDLEILLQRKDIVLPRDLPAWDFGLPFQGSPGRRAMSSR